MSSQVLWLLPGLGVIAVALVVATAVARRCSLRRRWNAALAGSGTAAAATALAWGLSRLGDWLGRARGPLEWLGQTAGAGSDPLRLAQAAGRMSLGAAVIFGGTLIACSWWRTRSAVPAPTLPVPLNRLAAVTAALSALVIMGLLAADVVVLESMLDLAAVAPIVACGLGLHALANPNQAPEAALFAKDALAHPADRSPAAAHSATAAADRFDPESILRRHGELRATEPNFAVAAASTPRAPGPAGSLVAADDDFTRIWNAAGGSGAVPLAIHRVYERGDSATATGALLGDLPAPTETAVVLTLTVLTLMARAGRVLLLGAEPEQLAARVHGLLGRLGVAAPGPVVARLGALKDTLARGELPVLVCLEMEELASHAMPTLGDGPMPWLAGVDLVMLVRADRLLPIAATHLAFTLRRLSLALLQYRATPSWVAVGEGTLGSQRLLEQSVARPFERLPLGAVTTAGVRVFIRRSATSTASELLQWSRVAAAAEVHIEDAVSELGEPPTSESAEKWHSHPGYHGRCALALLDERHLASLFRMRVHLAHQLEGGTHLGCWWVKPSPLMRFLTQPGTLAGLERQGELPSPRPVVGLHNGYVAAAHLGAALHEGKPDAAALRQAFGEAAVAQLLSTQKNIRTEGMRARWDARTRTIVRSAILTRAAMPWPDERRETVTQNIVEVSRHNDGVLLHHVDRRVAATRFYPYRVFQSRGALYQVRQATPQTANSRILVSPAAVGAVPTLPVLSIELAHHRWLGEIERHHFDKLSFARGVSALAVKESVTGALPRGSATASVRYAAVTAEYDSVAAVIAFERVPSTAALHHVGRLIDLILPAHLLAEPDDIEVLACAEGIGELQRPALAFVDRNLEGIGVAAALDASTVHDLLRWAWGVLYSCRCMNGCPECTPPDVLQTGSDKQGALKLLGG